LGDELQFIERHPFLVTRILIAFYTKLNTNIEKLNCTDSQKKIQGEANYGIRLNTKRIKFINTTRTEK